MHKTKIVVLVLLLSIALLGCAVVQSARANLMITTKSLPSTTVGVVFSQQLQATGGTGVYAWSVVSGTLPPGISLSPSGLLSGVPKSSGQFSFVVRVVDSKLVQVEIKLEIKG